MIGSYKKKIVLSLTATLVLTFLALGAFFFFGKIKLVPNRIDDIHIDSKAALKLNALEQVSKKNGITEWELKASSAALLKSENRAVLQSVQATFYTIDKKKVILTSERGILNTKTHDMQFIDNVVVRYETYTLKTDQLHYEKKSHIIRSKTRVRLEDGASQIEADGMEIQLKKNKLIFIGHVKGKFSEDSNLP